MFEILNSESSLPLAIVVSCLVLTSMLRPIVYAVATLILTRKASPEMRVKVLSVYCSNRRSDFAQKGQTQKEKHPDAEDYERLG